MTSEIEKLGDTLNSRMQHVQNATKGMGPEIGTITSGLGLKVGSVNNTIPRGAYLVSRNLTMSNPTASTNEVNNHKHTVSLPAKLGAFKAGDRVLVIWCGYEPVVVAVLENS